MNPLLVCEECDLVQQSAPPVAGEFLRCCRCGARLARRTSSTRETAFALASGAAILLIIGCSVPVVSIEVQGVVREATLFGAVRSLYYDDTPFVAALVLGTIVAVPAIELGAVLMLLVPACFRHRPGWYKLLFRLVQEIRPWNMVEVFLLGVTVSLVKLAHLAHVLPGLGLWSMAGVAVLLSTLAVTFEPRDVWTWVEAPADT